MRLVLLYIHGNRNSKTRPMSLGINTRGHCHTIERIWNDTVKYFYCSKKMLIGHLRAILEASRDRDSTYKLYFVLYVGSRNITLLIWIFLIINILTLICMRYVLFYTIDITVTVIAKVCSYGFGPMKYILLFLIFFTDCDMNVYTIWQFFRDTTFFCKYIENHLSL